MLTRSAPRTLTGAQVASFEERGFLLLERVIDESHLARLRATLDALLRRDPQRRTADFVADKDTSALRNINHFTRYWIAGAELVRQPVVLGALRDLLGDDIRFHHTKVFLKPPHEGTAKEWHQDLWSYVDAAERERLLALGPGLSFADAPLIAAQTYLDDATTENGCLRFVPGSHRRGLLAMNRSADRWNEDLYPATEVVQVPAPAGSVALFHALILHYSGPNRSAMPRRGPIVQYFAPSSALQLVEYPPDTPFGEELV